MKAVESLSKSRPNISVYVAQKGMLTTNILSIELEWNSYSFTLIPKELIVINAITINTSREINKEPPLLLSTITLLHELYDIWKIYTFMTIVVLDSDSVQCNCWLLSGEKIKGQHLF